MLQKFECYAWEITRIRSGSDERTSSQVSPGLGEFLVSWFLGIFLVFLAPSIGKSRRLGCQYLGYLGLLGPSYLSSL